MGTESQIGKVRLRKLGRTWKAIFYDNHGRKQVLDLGVEEENKARILVEATNIKEAALVHSLGKLREDVFRGFHGGNITIGSIYEDFEFEVLPGLSRNTREYREIDIKQFFDFAGCWDHHPHTVRRQVVIDWATSLLGKKSYKWGYINKRISSVKCFFSWCLEKGYVTSNPAKNISSRLFNLSTDQTTTEHHEAITRQELDIFLRQVKKMKSVTPLRRPVKGQMNHRYFWLEFLEVACEVAFETGLRLVDCADLDWGNLRGKILSVDPIKTRRKQNNKQEFVLSDRLLELLLQRTPPEKRVGAMFPEVRIRIVHGYKSAALFATFNEVWASSGLPGKKTFHGLRSGCAMFDLTKAIFQSKEMQSVREKLGHTTLNTTLAYVNKTGEALERDGYI